MVVDINFLVRGSSAAAFCKRSLLFRPLEGAEIVFGDVFLKGGSDVFVPVKNHESQIESMRLDLNIEDFIDISACNLF